MCAKNEKIAQVISMWFVFFHFVSDNEKILSDYGSAFVGMWKITHNYRVWNSNKHPALAEVTPR